MAHARLNASTAKRWINCPGSVNLSEGIPNKSSFFARQGTAAHGLLQVVLEAGVKHKAETGRYEFPQCDEYLGRVIRLVGENEDASMLKPGAKAKKDDFEVDEEMASAVQVHVDYVIERIEQEPSVEVMAEYKVEVPGVGYGTSDTIIDNWPDMLESMDYKHGVGVGVEVHENEQLRYYLLGKAVEDGFTHKTYRYTVVQPRKEHADGPVRSEDMSREELVDFYDMLKKAAEKTTKPNAPLRAGEWCKFCPAAGDCPELREKAQEAAQADFAEEPHPLEAPDEAHKTLDAETAGRLMRWVEITDAWGRSVKKRVTQMLMAGESVEDWKLVMGKEGNRKWALAEAEAAKAIVLQLPGLADQVYAPQKLKSPAQMEKIKGFAKQVKELINDPTNGLIHRPPGKAVVAKADDPRPSITPGEGIEADFADEETE